MSLHVIRLPCPNVDGRRQLEAAPPGVFKPVGILLWGTAAGCLVHQLQVVGEKLLASPLPAVMFESDVGWEYFERCLSEAPHHALPVVAPRDIGKFFRFDCPSAEPGQIITLDIEGRVDRAVLLGRMLPVLLPAPEPGVLIPAPGFDAEHSAAIRERMTGQQQ